MPPASSFISTCKPRNPTRHKQSPKVNCSSGNQFPFRNQAQAVLAWAVKEGMRWKEQLKSSDLNSSHRIFRRMRFSEPTSNRTFLLRTWTCETSKQPRNTNTSHFKHSVNHCYSFTIPHPFKAEDPELSILFQSFCFKVVVKSLLGLASL